MIFRNDGIESQQPTKIDKFLAAREATAAYEIPIDTAEKESVFTHCIFKAFEKPDPGMIETVTEDGQDIQVVPNRKLEDFLRREVSVVLAKFNPTLNQTPDVSVLSGDKVYIGRVRPKPVTLNTIVVDAAVKGLNQVSKYVEKFTFNKIELPTPTRARPVVAPLPVDLRDVAAVEIADALNRPPAIDASQIAAVRELSRTSGFGDAVAKATETAAVGHFETQTGFAVIGIEVEKVVTAGGGTAEYLPPRNESDTGVVRVAPAGNGCTVILQFSNGRGTALAALAGYIGHIYVEDGRIVSVNYIPSDNSLRWSEYRSWKTEIERLRAAVAAATRFGVFRLDDKDKAEALADIVRNPKRCDPALGLYAAYAYSEANQREKILSVLECMEMDLQLHLFDVALLARKIAKPSTPTYPIAPFCPMLTQGWNLLRARRVELPEVLDNAQDELVPGALWTTFKPERTNLIIDAIERGELR